VSKDRHPDSARLLAWIDRELNLWQSWQLRRHVSRCWRCRSRASELEAAIAAVEKRLGPASITSVEIAKARWLFRQSAAEFESEMVPAAPARRMKLATVSAVLAVCLSVLIWRQTPTDPEPDALDLLLAAAGDEASPVREAVREEQFTVEYRSGTAPVRRRKLRVLVSHQHRAWAARWSDGAGVVRNAFFASDRQPSSEFTPASGLKPAVFRRDGSHVRLVESTAGAAEDVETLILTWIRQQVWEPVSLAREVAEFCTRSGAVLRVSSGGAAVLWTARTALRGVDFEVHLEAKPGQAPSVLQVAWRSRRGSGALLVRRDERRKYDNLRQAAGLLYPSPRVASTDEAKTAIAKEPPMLPSPAVPVIEPAVSLDELVASEVAVLDVLHRQRLCKSDEVRVKRVQDAVEVTGAFAAQDQVDRLARALAPVSHVRLRLSSLEAFPEPAAARPAGAAVERQARPAAAEQWLRLRLDVGVRTSEREMFNTMNAVVADSEELLADSWALFQLAQRFPPAIERALDLATRSKLRAIADDHLVSLSVHVAAVDGRLALQQTSDRVEAVGQVPWQESLKILHADAKGTAEVLLYLFAGGGASGNGTGSDPEQAGLAGRLGRIRSLAAVTRSALSDHSNVALR
jgi:hypothetical protein